MKNTTQRPNCREPRLVQPGRGYRLLQPGEIIAEGDEYYKEDKLLMAILSARYSRVFNELMDVKSAKIPDYDNIRHAAQSSIRLGSQGYNGTLRFVSRATYGVPDYLTDVLGCHHIPKPDETTREAMAVLKGWAEQEKYTTQQKMDLKVEYVRALRLARDQKCTFNLVDFANRVFGGNSNNFITFANLKHPDLSWEFTPGAPSTIDRFLPLNYSKDGFVLQVEDSRIAKGITAANGTVTIPNLPKDVVDRIHQMLNS